MELRPDYPIRTARLNLRPLTVADTEALLGYRSRPDVCRYVPFPPMDTAEIARRLAGPWARRHLDAAGQALTLGVERSDTGVLIGDVVLFWHSEDHAGGEIGYMFDPEAAGRGYATEAADAVLRLAFVDLGLHRVVARIDARNVPSAGVARRLGMRQEAHLVSNEFLKGEWTDELDFAVLRDEWLARQVTG